MKTLSLAFFLSALSTAANAVVEGAPPSVVINVMAPLVVGDPQDLESETSAAAWAELDTHLAAMKAAGVHAVSTDVWWGLAEPADQGFDWRYYDKLSDHIVAAGLRWVPILSFHQCGGNVGDDCDIPLPGWLWEKLSRKSGRKDVRALQFVSEQGNASREYVSVWATSFVLGDYVELMKEFQTHFAAKATAIAEINVSLGPSGELRYPSYNSHDTGTGYPTRGGLQAYSTLAKASFGRFARRKYGSVAAVAKAWQGHFVQAGVPMAPPADPVSFFKRGVHRQSQYGRDFFDWYSGSLIAHGRLVMQAALATFSAGPAAFAGIDLGAKVPGIHWRIGRRQGDRVVLSDRLAELSAGLIRTSQNDWRRDELGRGYRPIIGLFADLDNASASSRVVLHFTCLEMADGQDQPSVQSLARSLVQWVGDEAYRQGVTIKGENALGWNIPDAQSWVRMRSALATGASTRRHGRYEGLTLLRMSDIYASPVAMAELLETTGRAP